MVAVTTVDALNFTGRQELNQSGYFTSSNSTNGTAGGNAFPLARVPNCKMHVLTHAVQGHSCTVHVSAHTVAMASPSSRPDRRTRQRAGERGGGCAAAWREVRFPVC